MTWDYWKPSFTNVMPLVFPRGKQYRLIWYNILQKVIMQQLCFFYTPGPGHRWYLCHYINDNVIKWKHFPCCWPIVRGIHRSPVNSPHKGQWREPVMFSMIFAWINGWVNNREAGDLRSHCAHYDVIAMIFRLAHHGLFQFCACQRHCCELLSDCAKITLGPGSLRNVYVKIQFS